MPPSKHNDPFVLKYCLTVAAASVAETGTAEVLLVQRMLVLGKNKKTHNYDTCAMKVRFPIGPGIATIKWMFFIFPVKKHDPYKQNWLWLVPRLHFQTYLTHNSFVLPQISLMHCIFRRSPWPHVTPCDPIWSHVTQCTVYIHRSILWEGMRGTSIIKLLYWESDLLDVRKQGTELLQWGLIGSHNKQSCISISWDC